MDFEQKWGKTPKKRKNWQKAKKNPKIRKVVIRTEFPTVFNPDVSYPNTCNHFEKSGWNTVGNSAQAIFEGQKIKKNAEKTRKLAKSEKKTDNSEGCYSC